MGTCPKKNSNIHRSSARESFLQSKTKNCKYKEKKYRVTEGEIVRRALEKFLHNISARKAQKNKLKKKDNKMENLVFNVNGKAVTTSRKVAEVFEKQHKNVLRSIRELKIPEDFDRLNFQPSVYKIPNPSGGKPVESPEYLITRDGFTLLAMGFTGSKAMQFKIAYIKAFNAMEYALYQTRIEKIACIENEKERCDEATSFLRSCAKHFDGPALQQLCADLKATKAFPEVWLSALIKPLDKAPSELQIAGEFKKKNDCLFHERLGWYEYTGSRWEPCQGV